MHDYDFFTMGPRPSSWTKSREFWNPGQDRLLAGGRRRPRHRPPGGLFLLGHGRPAADRPAPQRRHVQPRPPQPGADRDARAGDGPLRHRQPPLPGAAPAPPSPRRSSRPARRTCDASSTAPAAARRSTSRSRPRATRRQAAQDRLDPQGLPRPHRPRGGRPATTASRRCSWPTGRTSSSRCRSTTSARWRRALRGRRRRRGDHGDDPGDLRLPAARARLPASGQARSASATARCTSPTRCRPG